jgi:hypothetical protein
MRGQSLRFRRRIEPLVRIQLKMILQLRQFDEPVGARCRVRCMSSKRTSDLALAYLDRTAQ